MRCDVIRPYCHWQKQVEKLGFIFHTMYRHPYWDESCYYQFCLAEIKQQIEGSTRELHLLCLEVTERIVADEQWLIKMAIPEIYWDLIRNLWDQSDISLYGRFDLLWQVTQPAKMLQHKADTQTWLYEAVFCQWVWLRDMIDQNKVPKAADQYNSL